MGTRVKRELASRPDSRRGIWGLGGGDISFSILQKEINYGNWNIKNYFR